LQHPKTRLKKIQANRRRASAAESGQEPVVRGRKRLGHESVGKYKAAIRVWLDAVSHCCGIAERQVALQGKDARGRAKLDVPSEAS